jgi:hypothetical protein
MTEEGREVVGPRYPMLANMGVVRQETTKSMV